MAKLRSHLHSTPRTLPSPTLLSLIKVEGSTLCANCRGENKLMGCFPFFLLLPWSPKRIHSCKGTDTDTGAFDLSLSTSLSPCSSSPSLSPPPLLPLFLSPLPLSLHPILPPNTKSLGMHHHTLFYAALGFIPGLCAC